MHNLDIVKNKHFLEEANFILQMVNLMKKLKLYGLKNIRIFVEINYQI